MKRTIKFILLVFSLALTADLCAVLAAEDGASGDLIQRPVVEYKASQLRDPFQTYLIKEEVKPEDTLPQTATTTVAAPALDPGRFRVQGLIWGVRVPQAIINNKVLTIGDSIEGAVIVSIEKRGVTVSFNGVIYSLNAPGQTPVRTE